ncbi:MAG TPA: DUF1009 domain-containing protein, partial [Pseudolabrys sp.]|nr:DUF1009 domain-containing protein [Pseudolabrys sp.]
MTAAMTGAAGSPLAIICGGGSLPFAVADAATKRGRRVVLFAIRGAADPERIEQYPHQWGSVGQFGRLQRMLNDAGCREVVFIGSLVRPALWQLRLDFKTLTLLPRLAAAFRGGDNHLLSGVGDIFERNGFHLLGAHEVAPEILMPEGALGKTHPSDQDRNDIETGF